MKLKLDKYQIMKRWDSIKIRIEIEKINYSFFDINKLLN